MVLMEENLYLEGKILKDTDLISRYNIGRNLTLFLSLRLRGGVVGKGASSSPKPSFREAVENRSILVQTTDPKTDEYIVEQIVQSPCVELVTSTIKELYDAYIARANICRFNGFCSNFDQLHQWIHQNWFIHVEITL